MVIKFPAKKNLGQHFLTDTNYCRKIVRYAQIQPGDTVVEIGPGTGQLTKVLLVAAKKVIGLEFDTELVQYLKDHLPDIGSKEPHLTLIESDVLTFDWSNILNQGPVKIIGNLPYNISTRILMRMSEIKNWFQSFTFMVQKEVADRILASPTSKDYGYFTLLMEYHFKRLAGFSVPPDVFTPKPRVESYVMQLIPRESPYPELDYTHFLYLIQKAFQHRRKTLWNNLKIVVENSEALRTAFANCQIGRRDRPEEVGLDQYICLTRMV